MREHYFLQLSIARQVYLEARLHHVVGKIEVAETLSVA